MTISDSDPEKLFQRIREEILEVEKDLNSGEPDSFPKAEKRVEFLQARLEKLRHNKTPESNVLAVSVLTARAHVERANGNLKNSADTYAEAIDLLPHCDLDGETLDRRASNLNICSGLAFLSGDSREDWEAALEQFDQAIAIREKAPHPDTGTTWGLAAAWMNRAEALGNLGSEENLNEATVSLDRAIEVLRDFDLDQNPSYRSRLALAWMNRGNCLARLSLDYSEDRAAESLRSYEEAVNVLRPGKDQGIEESYRMLAVALSNLSRARFQLRESEEAEKAASESRETLELIEEMETADPELAGLGLITRITLCSIFETSSTEDEDCSAEITDLVEDGLQRIQKAGRQVVDALADPLGQLFLFGAETYRRYLPAFLDEFILEFLDTDPDADDNPLAYSANCHEVAVQTLWRGIADLQNKGFGTIDGVSFTERSERISQWQKCRERLAEIRSVYFETE